jgi:L-seryl-tRNA(Ser) seleniumtransferase
MTKEQTPNPFSETDDPRRNLASVSVLLEHPRVKDMLRGSNRPLVINALRQALDQYRKKLIPGDSAPDAGAIVAAAASFLRVVEGERLRPVVNATGIILHTGLGRAVLPQSAVDALAGLNRCCNLQIDMETGLRGKRNFVSERLLCELTGAEAAMVVNNNASATLLILTALCQGREVVVSRGQVIEIGGSFRLHECIRQSGAILVEIGTTNKTHLRDYEGAITGQTGALMHIHPSNYRVMGFTQEVSIAELATLKKGHDLLIIDDLGGGALVDLAPYGLPHEPTVSESIAAGADLACFSGDKLIGGPQAGIIVGRGDLIRKMKKHPLTRMLRVGKMTDLVLERTLRLFLEPDVLLEANPTLRMITMGAEQIRRRAIRLQATLQHECAPADIRLLEGESATGGGSLPVTPLKTFLLAIRVPGISAEGINVQLRRNEPPVIARIERDEVLLDLRTVFEDEEPRILEALILIVRSSRQSVHS